MPSKPEIVAIIANTWKKRLQEMIFAVHDLLNKLSSARNGPPLTCLCYWQPTQKVWFLWCRAVGAQPVCHCRKLKSETTSKRCRKIWIQSFSHILTPYFPHCVGDRRYQTYGEWKF